MDPMPDVIEKAKSSRSKCRHCGLGIEEGERRFGTSELLGGFPQKGTTWFHLACAARHLPDQTLAVLGKSRADASIIAIAKAAAKARPRFPFGERAASARANCLACERPILAGELRVVTQREIAGPGPKRVTAFLHPACAVAHLKQPELAALLSKNSTALSKQDKEQLAKLLSAKGPKPKAPAVSAKPNVDRGLVFADELIEKGDVRGELIVVASQMAELGPADARWRALDARAVELKEPATEAWQKEIDRTFFLERGFPGQVTFDMTADKRLVRDPANAKFPTHPWILGLNLEHVTRQTMPKLFGEPGFARLRSLMVLDRIEWDDFCVFFENPALRQILLLTVKLHVGLRGARLLLSSTLLDRLTELSLDSEPIRNLNPKGLESVDGLRALRRLSLGFEESPEIVQALLASPLVQRLEELDVSDSSWPDEIPVMPKLRRLGITSFGLAPEFGKDLAARLAKAQKSLPALTHLDLKECPFMGTGFTPAAMKKIRAAFGSRVIESPALPGDSPSALHTDATVVVVA
jgi:hypothetical protein